ncbi:MAG TPA: FAD-dependent oxidoreductase, partial [Acidimicrobiales bacterium]
MNDNPRIVIIGAGPTGLGAGYRLQELGYDDWVILEANDYVGGLATSFTDDAGFTYDIGGHVMFSHYQYYDELVEKLMDGDFTELNREAWVWMEDRFVSYPFQNNIRSLEPQTVFDCVNGLIEAQRAEHNPTNFKEWVDAVFGAGIAKHFMIPYNFKVWATPPELMNHVWIGERVSVVDVEAILRNVLLGEDQRSWGPNNTFKYPLRGGTGFLYEGLRTFVEDHLELNTPVASVDSRAKVVRSRDGRTW